MSSKLFCCAKARDAVQDLGLLALRLWAAQEFVHAGWTKLGGGLAAPAWFASLSFPFPHSALGADVNWVAAGLAELLLGVALALGAGTRLAALGLMYITWVAVYSVHFDLGWAGWNQIETEAGLGFKVPLMLGLMLLALLTQGGGRYALDRLLCRRGRRACCGASGGRCDRCARCGGATGVTARWPCW